MDTKKLLNKIPGKPGVYIMKDYKGEPLYVGKAKNLKKRVSSYFQKKHSSPWTTIMVGLIEDIETIVVANELEALLLENNLIKNYKTPFNIRMRDDKSYPYLKITNEKYPRLVITRQINNDGGKYFGPYLSTLAMRETFELLKRLFGLVTHKYREGQRACLYYQMGQCSAPYAGKIPEEEYLNNVAGAVKLLGGQYKSVLKDLQIQMKEAAANTYFEKAAKLRDQIQSLERIIERQRIVSTGRENRDIAAVAMYYSIACVEILEMRDGKVVDDFHIILENIEGKKPEEILTTVLSQFYLSADEIPREIILSHAIDDREMLEKALLTKGFRTNFVTPRKGEKQRLVQLASGNAEHHLIQSKDKKRLNREILAELQSELGLANLPLRIEAYDISNLGKTEAVGAMACFVDGEPHKDHYRKFIIKSVSGQNDTAMMAEIITRRLMNNELPKPDLMLIDGGKGQISAVFQVMRKSCYSIPIIGLAKKMELIFKPETNEPIILARDSKALLLLEKIRDEVHRYGISFHRQRRGKSFLK